MKPQQSLQPAVQALEAWLTKSEALQVLGVSERSLDRLVTARKVEKQTRPRPGRTPEPVYLRSDVERVSAQPAHVMPLTDTRAGNVLGAAQAVATPTTPAADAMIAQFLAAIATAFAAPRAITAPEPAVAQWLTVQGASQVSGLSQRLIKQLIADRTLSALRDGREWKIRRDDLAALRAANRARPANRAKTMHA